MTVIYPWQLSATSPPGDTQQAIFNRTVNVYRMDSPSTGTNPYSGDTPANETMIFSGLIANIQLRAPGRSGKMSVPSDISTKPQWIIFIPGQAQYSIRDRDIVVDDEEYRYGVGSAVWSVFGYTLECIRLEA